MAESHVISALVTRRSELSGLIEHYMQEIQRMGADLQHLDATIKMFAPDFDLRSVRVKRHHKRNIYFKAGECARMVLDVLREAGNAISTETVALAVIKKKQLDAMDKGMVVFFKKAAITALRHQANKGLVKNTGFAPDGVTLLWQIA